MLDLPGTGNHKQKIEGVRYLVGGGYIDESEGRAFSDSDELRQFHHYDERKPNKGRDMKYSGIPDSTEIVMFLGRNTPIGEVTDEELRYYLKNNVAKEFSSFTVTHVVGYWEGMEERTATVTVIVPEVETTDALQKMGKLAAEYANAFEQQAVAVKYGKTNFELLIV